MSLDLEKHKDLTGEEALALVEGATLFVVQGHMAATAEEGRGVPFLVTMNSHTEAKGFLHPHDTVDYLTIWSRT